MTTDPATGMGAVLRAALLLRGTISTDRWLLPPVS